MNKILRFSAEGLLSLGEVHLTFSCGCNRKPLADGLQYGQKCQKYILKQQL